MQSTDEENLVKSRSDEDSINFRPSPNFKHMKKYLKSKFEEAMMIEARSSSEEQNSPLSGHNKQKKVNVASTPVQPPLPPHPPPPDSPPLITNLKKEIVDDEYQCSTTETTPEFNNSEELKTVTIKTDQSETSTEKPNVTMCRNFARGTCKKGAACIFVHELILSQLPGVYTFCRNFQNSVCSYPKCKFVHATVFEKEYFFRTGYLPPHTLAHLKEATVQQPPPPPPQPEGSMSLQQGIGSLVLSPRSGSLAKLCEHRRPVLGNLVLNVQRLSDMQQKTIPSFWQSGEKPTEVPPIYNNALPPPTLPCIPPAVVVPYAENGVERSDPNIFRTIHAATTTTSPKREWSESQEVSSSTRDLDSGESLAKKCKNCDSNEFREQLIKTKVEKFSQSNKEFNQKIAQLNKKNATLAVVIGALLKTPKAPSATNGLSITGEKEPNLMSNNNFTTLLAKMLLSVDSGVQPDAS